MFIVTNTIRVKADFREKMVKQFQSSHTKEQMVGVKGFLAFEVFYRDEVDGDKNLSEVVALSRWEDEKAQLAWMNSDSFKNLHKRSKIDKAVPDNKRESPVIGNTVSRYHTA